MMRTELRSCKLARQFSPSETLEARRLLSAVLFSSPVSVATSAQEFLSPSVESLGNGHSDIVALDEVNDAIDVFSGSGDGTFGQPQVLDAGHVTSGLFATDLGNGHIDLVAQNTSAGTIDVLLGNGNGTFRSPITYNAGNGILHIADLGNGHPDLIVPTANGINILLGNGSGNFSGVTTLATSSRAYPLQIADLGTGHPDFVYFTSTPQALNVAIGHGDGTFAAPQVILKSVTITSIQVADLGNGHPDLILSNRNGPAGNVNVRSESVLLGNGDGTFGAPTTFPIALASVQVVDPGNGPPDLVYTGTNAVYVQVGNGDGTFKSPVSYPLGFLPGNVVIGDLGTGHPDIFLTGENKIGELTGNGDGSFQASHAFTAPPFQTYPSINMLDGKTVVLFESLGTVDAIDYMYVLPGSGNQLAFSPQPTSTTTDSPFTTFSVQVRDPNGAVITTANPMITLEANLSTGALTGVTTVQAVNGVATFSGIAITTVGTYSLTASDGSDYPTDGIPVNVYAAQPLGTFSTAADRAKIRADSIALSAVHTRTPAYRAAFYASTTGQGDVSTVSDDQATVQETIAETKLSVNGGAYNPADPEDSPEATKYDVAAARLQLASDKLQLSADLSQAVNPQLATDTAAAAQLLFHDKNQLAYDTARLAALGKNQLTTTVAADLTAVYQAAQLSSLDLLSTSDHLIADQSTNLNNSAYDQETVDEAQATIFQDLSPDGGGSGVATAADIAALASAKADLRNAPIQARVLIAADNANTRETQARDAAALKAANVKLASDLKHHL